MSNILEQIDKAIGAHGAWKVKLKQNIDGTLPLIPAEVSVDNRCEFGKWLYSLTGAQASDPHYKEVLALHKAFYSAAGDVVSKVMKGDKARCRGFDWTERHLCVSLVQTHREDDGMEARLREGRLRPCSGEIPLPYGISPEQFPHSSAGHYSPTR